MRAIYAAIFLLFLLSGCAHEPPPRMSCNFEMRTVGVATPGTGPDYSQDLDSKLLRHNKGEADTAMLFLSGGSLNGAYGAGYLQAWEKSGKMPRFRVVTGISTGSILATGAFIGDMDMTVQGYSIINERQLLTPWATGEGTTQYLKVLRKGAFADLVPLRTEMRKVINDAVLHKVAAAADANRTLYVGAVDVDTGDAVAFDLTKMAQRYVKAKEDGNAVAQETAIRCYVEAIAASSSAPLAAPPVYIDNRMYVDGGMRFGVFSDDVGERVSYHRQNLVVSGGEDDRPRSYVIINGNQRIGPRCGKADGAACTNDYPTGRNEPPKEWDLLSLAMRSEGILVNSVYRFSAKHIEDQATQEKKLLYFTQIYPDVDAHVAKIDDPKLDKGEMSCAAWKQRDKELLNPIQFYPRYMRCLIDYGRTRAEADQWWVPRPDPDAQQQSGGATGG